MNRRTFMAALTATPVAQRLAAHVVVKDGASGSVMSSEAPIRIPSHRLTGKQQEAWEALHTPGVRAVLFSGGRACGKTHLARVWADSVSATGGEYLVIVPTAHHAIDWQSEITSRGGYVVDSAGMRGSDRFRNVIIDQAHAMRAEDLRYAYALIHDEGRVLLTSLVAGAGMKELRRLFPLVGWNTRERYHVNASMMENPYLANLSR